MCRKVVIAVDGSKFGEFGFSWYLDNLRIEGDEVHLIHVYDLHDVTQIFVLPSGPCVLPDNWEDLAKRSYEKGQKLVEEYKGKLEAEKIKSIGYLRPSHGSPGDEICKLAQEVNADCIVVGSRGVGTIRRTLLGSTSDYVLNHSHMPVIVCKFPEEQ